jgi:hypothetical protein
VNLLRFIGPPVFGGPSFYAGRIRGGTSVRLRKALRIAEEERDILTNEPRALAPPDLWARNSVAYARPLGAVAVRFLVTSRAR